jgi:hypothetical protein
MDAIAPAGIRFSGLAWHGWGQRQRVWREAAALVLLLTSALILASAAWHGLVPHTPSVATTAVTAPLTGAATMPSTPTDGVLTLVIPLGTAADQEAGGRGYEMPPVISLKVGDKIVIRNDDAAPHMILYAWVRPGETSERTFTQPGSEVYSSGCGLHAASILNFTTIFVSR